MSDRLVILHRPTGTDAPYYAGPDERVPRDPIGGDMVGIGFLTQPGRAASDVRLFWSRNGRPQTPLQGRPVARCDHHAARHWRNLRGRCREWALHIPNQHTARATGSALA